MTAPMPEYGAYAPQNTTPQPEQPPQVPAGKSRRMMPLRATVIVGVVALIVGALIGGVAVYGSARSLTSAAKTQINDLQAQNDTLSDQNYDLQNQISDLKDQLGTYDQYQNPQEESGVPKANPGTTGLTVTERNVTTRYSTTVVDYVVRNDTDMVLDNINIDYRYLDADGNTVFSSGSTNNASVDIGKTGVVTVYVGLDREEYPNIVGIQIESIYATVDGERYSAELGDEPVVNF